MHHHLTFYVLGKDVKFNIAISPPLPGGHICVLIGMWNDSNADVLLMEIRNVQTNPVYCNRSARDDQSEMLLRNE